MVRRVVGARAEPHEPRLRRVAGLLVADHLDGLVGEVLREVIALLRPVGLVDEPVVFDQIRIPLVGLAAEEAVEAIEALLQRPLLAARARGDVLLGNVVVLAQPERAPAVVLEDLPDRGALGRECGRSRREIRSAPSVMQAMPLRWWLRPVRKVERVGEHSAVVCHCEYIRPLSASLLQRRHVDPAAERRPRRPDRCRRTARSGRSAHPSAPLPAVYGSQSGNGIADVELDDAFEGFLRHRLISLHRRG